MGMVTSFMGKGIPSTQAISFLMGTLHKQFGEKKIESFDDFHCAILDIFTSINSALPGRHYDVPSTEQVKEVYQKWKDARDDEKKEVLVTLLKKHININRLDDSTMIVGMLTPPAAMAAKRAAENVAQMSVIKAIPDVIFVPSATVLLLFSAKLTRRMFLGSSHMPEAANGGRKEEKMESASSVAKRVRVPETDIDGDKWGAKGYPSSVHKTDIDGDKWGAKGYPSRELVKTAPLT